MSDHEFWTYVKQRIISLYDRDFFKAHGSHIIHCLMIDCTDAYGNMYYPEDEEIKEYVICLTNLSRKTLEETE